MYPVPNFASASDGGSVGPVSAGSFSSGGPSLSVSGTGDGIAGGGGQNQWMNYPSFGGSPVPYGGGFSSGPVYGGTYSGSPSTFSTTLGAGAPGGFVPPQGSPYPSPGALPYGANLTGGPGAVGSSTKLPGGAYGGPTTDPLFTQGYAGWLSGQLGTGINPYGLSAFLPSTGGYTAPGQVSAPLTPGLQQLEQFFQTGKGGGPGMQSLAGMAQTGDPISQLPAWQQMVQAEQHNIDVGANNLKEQFAGLGDLNSTTLGTAAGDYETQAILGENAALTQAQTGALESAAGRQLGAGEFLQQGAEGLGQYLQGLDEASIQALMGEYFATTPQENPLLALESQFATSYPPIYGKQGFGASLGQGLGSALGSGIGQGLAGLIFGG